MDQPNSILEYIWAMYIRNFTPYLEMEYVGQPDSDTDMHDRPSVMTELEKSLNRSNISSKKRQLWIYFGLGLLIALSIKESPIAIIRCITCFLFIYMIYYSQYVSDQPVIASKIMAIPRKDGIYHLKTWFLIPVHQGIGYVMDGTLYTRYRVTLGARIYVDDYFIPCYADPETDQVAYGNKPRWGSVCDSERVIVALGVRDTQRILMYYDDVMVLASGKILLRGNKSFAASIGSPIFKIVLDEEQTAHTKKQYQIVGTVDFDAIHDPEKATSNSKAAKNLSGEEKICSDHILPAENTIQFFRASGSGGTRTVMAELVHDGLRKYCAVYVTGPSKVQCIELHSALSSTFLGQVSLLTSDADFRRRKSTPPIVVATHETVLTMLVRGNSRVLRKGLWIMDEAHCMNSKSQCLKHLLRHHVKTRGGESVEMTATGYNFKYKTPTIKRESNFPIEDVVRGTQDMLDSLLNEADCKVVVFVTSIDGSEQTSSNNLKIMLTRPAMPVIQLSRKTFDINYTKAKALSKGYILTTDISECGANFMADIVYDFQMTTKAVSTGRDIRYQEIKIDECQRVQRRSGLGRFTNGTYISPGLECPESNTALVEYQDVELFTRCMGIPMFDIQPTNKYDIELSPRQLQAWVDIDEQGFKSPYLVSLMVDSEGYPREKTDLYRQLVEWATSDIVQVTVGNECFTVGFWDERDSDHLIALALEIGVIKVHNGSDKLTAVDKMTTYISASRMRAARFLYGQTEDTQFEDIDQGEQEREGLPVAQSRGIGKKKNKKNKKKKNKTVIGVDPS